MGIWTPKGEREVTSDGNVPPNRAERRAMLAAVKRSVRTCARLRDRAAHERGTGTPNLPIREAMRRAGTAVALFPETKGDRHTLLSPPEEKSDRR